MSSRRKLGLLAFLPLLMSSLFGCATALPSGDRLIGDSGPRGSRDSDYTDDGASLNPHHAAVRGKILAGFEALSKGDASQALDLMADDVHYIFEGGDHALGGERHSKKAVTLWFQRLFRLFKNEFRIYRIEVSGAPWNTTAITYFQDHVKPLEGAGYANSGVQIAKIKWGTVVDVHTYVDTARLRAALAFMRERGIEEAGAPPIVD